METAFAWIGQIMSWVGAFFPRWVILDTTEGAVKYKRGKNPVYCGPGIHWYWPVLTTWVPYPTARQTDRLESQTIESLEEDAQGNWMEGVSFQVMGTITYEVKDLFKLLTTTHSATKNTVAITAAAVYDVLSQYSWRELTTKRRRTLKKEIKDEAQRQLEPFGIRVLEVGITSLARTNAVVKMFQSNSTEET